MAEEGTLGVARASNDRDETEEPSKEELQRRMEEARNQITQTVTEIKETVTNQYYSVKESVTDALDWRHHFRKNPVAFSVGALAVGFAVGYGIAGSLKGRSGADTSNYPSYDETDVFARTGATPQRYTGEHSSTEDHSVFHGHSYAAQPILEPPRRETAEDYAPQMSYEAASGEEEEASVRGGNYGLSAGRQTSTAQEEEEQPRGPSLYERFKGTTAYDRLQTEVASLGDRFIEELSSTAHTVVLPALFNKIKELFGVDLSGGKQGRHEEQRAAGQSAQGATSTQTATSREASSAQAQSASAASGASTARSSATGSSYATSENRPYGAQGQANESSRSENDSILDLDR